MVRFIIAAAAVLTLACGNGGDGVKTGEEDPCLYDHDITLIGDSNTFASGYADLIADLYPIGEVTNIAWGGTSTEDWLPGGYYLKRSPVARVASILLGTIDASTGRKAEDYAGNLEEIVGTLLAHGACRIVLLSPPEIHLPKPHANRLLDLYADEISVLCEEERVECGPNLFDLLDADSFERDGVHMNGKGHARVADALAPHLEPH